MALVLADRIKETSTSTGTGSFTLAGAQDGFQSFAAVGDGNTTYYAIQHLTLNEYEVGIGTYTSSGTLLSRDTILTSSNSNNAVNFSAGTKAVFVTVPFAATVYEDASDNVTVGGKITVGTGPSTTLDVATKGYVDGVASAAIHLHEAVRVEREGNLNATYDNGTAGVGATLTNAGTQEALVIDGVTLNTSDRVLVYEQTDATQNGVYTVTNTGSVSTNWVLTRATDADSAGDGDPNSLDEGSYFYVQEGTAGAGESYVCNVSGTIVFGTTDITFAQFSATPEFTGGTNIDITGQTISLTGTVDETNGGTGNNAYTTGDILYSSATNTLAKLSGNTTTTGKYLKQTGDGANSAAPVWDEINLGTDTAGDYVATGAVSGVGLSGSASGEGSTFTVTSNATSANTVSTLVARDASGDFSAGTITAALSGNASTATTWQTARSLTLSGDVSGTATGIDGSGNIAVTTTIGANSVALGTDTTGNYVASLVAGAAIDLQNNSGEGATPTIDVDLSELSTSTTDGDGDFFVVVDGSNVQRKLTKGNINLSGFNNDSGFITSADGGNAATLDGLDSTQFLRSDAADTKTSGDLSFADNVKAVFGAGSDLQIYHDAGDSYIADVGTGNFRLKTNGLALQIQDSGDLDLANFNNNGSVYLKHVDTGVSTTRLQTTSSGIDVTGTVTAQAPTATDGLITVKGASGDYSGGIALVADAGENATDWFRIASIQSGGSHDLRVSVSSDTTPTWDQHYLNINSGGDISFYEDTGTTAKFFWDASTERLGLGTDSPSTILHAVDAGGSIRMQNSSGTAKYIQMRSDSADSHIEHIGGPGDALRINNQASGTIEFLTAGSEAARFDSSQNFLVGTTSTTPAVSNDSNGIALQANGTVQFSANATTTAIINRKATDGSILQFRKDGSVVGDIGVASLDLYIGEGTVNLRFDGENARIFPATTNGAVSDGNLDLGADTIRFKDLYLSSGIYAGSGFGSNGQVLTSNGTTATWQDAGGGFDSGTLMLFQQTAAPTGWTKQTTHNNKALRVVSGTAGSGGSSAFTTAFGTPSVSGSVSVSGNINNTTLSVSQIPSHSHSITVQSNSTNPPQIFGSPIRNFANSNTGSTGGGGSHNHGHNMSGNLSSATAGINVQYVDLIIASKD